MRPSDKTIRLKMAEQKEEEKNEHAHSLWRELSNWCPHMRDRRTREIDRGTLHLAASDPVPLVHFGIRKAEGNLPDQHSACRFHFIPPQDFLYFLNWRTPTGALSGVRGKDCV